MYDNPKNIVLKEALVLARNIIVNRSAGNQDLDPLVNKSRTDSWTSINWPIAKSQPSETELYISDNNHAVSPLDAPGSPEGKIENSLSPKIQQEQTMEKHEELTEKQQPRNLMST
jgi:hypothetical protein